MIDFKELCELLHAVLKTDDDNTNRSLWTNSIVDHGSNNVYSILNSNVFSIFLHSNVPVLWFATVCV